MELNAAAKAQWERAKGEVRAFFALVLDGREDEDIEDEMKGLPEQFFSGVEQGLETAE